jgi:hypothetical protein
MRTARDVLKVIDDQIADLEFRAGRICVDALAGEYDRDSYREAMTAAAGLKAVQALRSEIAGRIAIAPEQPLRRRSSQKGR